MLFLGVHFLLLWVLEEGEVRPQKGSCTTQTLGLRHTR